MENTRDEFLSKVLSGYAGSYDISREPVTDCPQCTATAAFHLTETQYVVTERATMWKTSSDEYAYFFSVEHLTDSECERLIGFARQDGLGKIDLAGNKNHMCTRIVAIFIADRADEAAVTRIRKCKLHRYFQFGLKGWMEFHTVLACPEQGSVCANAYGRETAKYLSGIMHPETAQKKKNRVWGLIRQLFD